MKLYMQVVIYVALVVALCVISYQTGIDRAREKMINRSIESFRQPGPPSDCDLCVANFLLEEK